MNVVIRCVLTGVSSGCDLFREVYQARAGDDGGGNLAEALYWISLREVIVVSEL